MKALLRQLTLASALAALVLAGCGSPEDNRDPDDKDPIDQEPVWTPSFSLGASGDVEIEGGALTTEVSVTSSVVATSGLISTYRLRFDLQGGAGELSFGLRANLFGDDVLSAGTFPVSGSQRIDDELTWEYEDETWVAADIMGGIEACAEDEPPYGCGSAVVLTEVEWKKDGLVKGTYTFELENQEDAERTVTLTGSFEVKITAAE